MTTNLNPELAEALDQRNLALFLGADLPREVTGLPSRADIARELARRKGLDESLPLAEVAQRVGRAGNRWEFTNFIRNALDTAGLSAAPFHQRVAVLVKEYQIEILITTAYDNLLDLAFQQAGTGLNHVVRGGDVHFVKPGRPTLVKLYGDAQQPDTLVVTDRDHSDLLRDRDREPILDEVRAAFRRHTLLFLGYSLADPDFRFLFDQVAESRLARTAYAVWTGLPEIDVQMWRDRGIVILETDPLSLLNTLLERRGEVVPTPSPAVKGQTERIRQSHPPRRERDWIPFKLHIARLAGQTFEVCALETPMGEPHAVAQLPFAVEHLTPILKALELGQFQPDRFTEPETRALEDTGLLRNARLVPDLLPLIGRGLYQALFPDQVGTAFQMAMNEARKSRDTVALQLRIDHDAVGLARYPWELVHDGHRHLLSGGIVELTRYIAYPEAVTTLPAAPPWRLLYIAPRPGDVAPLPQAVEQPVVWRGLEPLSETGMLALDRLDPPTYEALLDQMSVGDYHILHFDGHGLFARRCPACAGFNPPQAAGCHACSAFLEQVPALGYLVFEDKFGDADYVSAEAMENLLIGGEVRLILLSACRSGVVSGESIFGGLGPGLIRAGVPAVVGMQLSVSVEDAVQFAHGFYTALAEGQTLARAVAEGRRRLFRAQSWFIPTLYLRGTGGEGRLFVEP